MKKIKVLIILILLAFGVVGCGKQDINKLVLVSAMGFDKDDDGFKLVAQVVNRNILIPDPPQVSPVFVVTSKGQTVFECVRNLNDLLPNRVYLINLQLVIFSEEIAKEGIKDYVHFFMSFPEAQHVYNVLITKGITAEEFLRQMSVFSLFPTRTLIDKLETSVDYYGFGKKTFVEMLYTSVMSETDTLVLSSVEVTGNLEEGESVDQNKKTKIATEIKISDLAVFEGDKLKGWLNKEESVSYNFVRGEIKRTIITVDGEEDNKISSVVNNASSKVKVELVNNNPKARIDLKLSAYIIEDSKGKLEIDTDYCQGVRVGIERKIKENINKCIEKAKNELEIDIFNIADLLYKKYPKWWNENKENYKEIFKNMEIEVNVEVTIRRFDI